MIIRKANEVDFPEIAKLRWEHKVIYDGDGARMAQETFERDFVDYLYQSVGSGLDVFIGIVDDVITTMAFLTYVAKVPKPSVVARKQMIYLSGFYTRQGFRKKGYGKRMIQHIKKWAMDQGYGSIFLWSSLEGKKFYAENDFIWCDELYEYYEVDPNK